MLQFNDRRSTDLSTVEAADWSTKCPTDAPTNFPAISAPFKSTNASTE